VQVAGGGGQVPYGVSADVWSLGVTAIELATGSPPHCDLGPIEVTFRLFLVFRVRGLDQSRWHSACISGLGFVVETNRGGIPPLFIVQMTNVCD